MNVRNVTGEGHHSPLWAYITFATTLMIATFGGWFVWIKIQSGVKRRTERYALSEVLEPKGV